MLTKKKITRLLNASYRKSIMNSMPALKQKEKKIAQYARYVVDFQTVHRNKTLSESKVASYGFCPICPLCAVLKDGTIAKVILEFNTVNHFIREKNDLAAVETVKCILIEWCKENKDIAEFDIDKIDSELSKIEQEYVSKKKAEKEKELQTESV